MRGVDLVKIWFAVTLIFSFWGNRTMDEMYSLKFRLLAYINKDDFNKHSLGTTDSQNC